MITRNLKSSWSPSPSRWRKLLMRPKEFRFVQRSIANDGGVEVNILYRQTCNRPKKLSSSSSTLIGTHCSHWISRYATFVSSSHVLYDLYFQISIWTMGIGVGTLVAGLFGMNVRVIIVVVNVTHHLNSEISASCGATWRNTSLRSSACLCCPSY